MLRFIWRRTLGFGKTKDRIAISQFAHGIRRIEDGAMIDPGTGLSERTVQRVLRKLVTNNFIVEERNSSLVKGDEESTFSLKFVEKEMGVTSVTPGGGGVKSVAGGVTSVTPTIHTRYTKHTTISNTIPTSGNGLKKKKKSKLFGLSDLKLEEDETNYIAGRILEKLKSEKSQRYYQLVAKKVPETTIFTAISEIEKDGGAYEPAKVFTKRMEEYAQRTIENRSANTVFAAGKDTVEQTCSPETIRSQQQALSIRLGDMGRPKPGANYSTIGNVVNPQRPPTHAPANTSGNGYITTQKANSKMISLSVPTSGDTARADDREGYGNTMPGKEEVSGCLYDYITPGHPFYERAQILKAEREKSLRKNGEVIQLSRRRSTHIRDGH